ncbi:hypothetical protein [Nocardia brasiliensis]|uniref:hypothetical protein n=1 Tax=Nocardia brasiliensis TaxID=37326 RepID=UPI00366BB9DD
MGFDVKTVRISWKQRSEHSIIVNVAEDFDIDDYNEFQIMQGVLDLNQYTEDSAAESDFVLTEVLAMPGLPLFELAPE